MWMWIRERLREWRAGWSAYDYRDYDRALANAPETQAMIAAVEAEDADQVDSNEYPIQMRPVAELGV
jgi:hypothetical protein